MMNIQNLISQLGNSSNPMSMLMGMLNPNQKQQVNQFQNKSNIDQAQAIADYCNQNNISKEQLQNIIGMLRKR